MVVRLSPRSFVRNVGITVRPPPVSGQVDHADQRRQKGGPGHSVPENGTDATACSRFRLLRGAVAADRRHRRKTISAMGMDTVPMRNRDVPVRMQWTIRPTREARTAPMAKLL